MKFNVTGHQSLMILQSIPYSLAEASNLQHLSDISDIRQYIINTYLDSDEKLCNIEVDIHWDGLDDIENDYDNVEQKSEILIDETHRNGEIIVQPSINVINHTDLSHDNHVRPQRETSDKINYFYYYNIENDDNEYKFDNNNNEANIYYSRTLNLALMWDYCYLWRLVFAIFTCLKWPKTARNETPKEITQAHVWARSAVWKAYIFGNWLLTHYSKWAGGVGTYLLEAFVHDNPDGYGFYVINQQAAEHFGKWIKENRKTCGSANKDNYLHEIADNFDVYSLGRFMYDMIDMSNIVDDEVLNSLEKFNIDEIRKIHKNLLLSTPKLFQMYVKKFGELHVGGKISPCLARVKKRDKNVFTKLSQSLNQQMNDLLNVSQNDDDNPQQQREQSRQWRRRWKDAPRMRSNIQNRL